MTAATGAGEELREESEQHARDDQDDGQQRPARTVHARRANDERSPKHAWPARTACHDTPGAPISKQQRPARIGLGEQLEERPARGKLRGQRQADQRETAGNQRDDGQRQAEIAPPGASSRSLSMWCRMSAAPAASVSSANVRVSSSQIAVGRPAVPRRRHRHQQNAVVVQPQHSRNASQPVLCGGQQRRRATAVNTPNHSSQRALSTHGAQPRIGDEKRWSRNKTIVCPPIQRNAATTGGACPAIAGMATCSGAGCSSSTKPAINSQPAILNGVWSSGLSGA